MAYSGYNLQGIIRKSTVNTLVQFDKFGYYSQNVGNYNTYGYKARRFEEVMNENGYVHGVERRDFKEGAFQLTQHELDVGIKGPGFIPVTSPSGEIFYTRDGSFTKDKDGTLITTSGDIVGGGIQIDGTSVKVEIKPNGEVYQYHKITEEPQYLGTIPLVQFANPEGLEDAGGNKFRATEKCGEAQLVAVHDRIAQYGIERSNVDIMDHVNDIMRLNTSLLASTSLMTVVDKMYEKAINIRE